MAARPNRTTTAALGIGATALLVRLVHLWQIRDAPVFTHLVVDGIAYDAWAREIAGGRWIGDGVFYQAPLYPYFLATIYAVIGRNLAAVRVVQAVLGSASCVLLAVAGARVFGRRCGLLAAFLLAVWPSAVFADSLIQKSALDGFFVCALFAAIVFALDASRPARWLWAGLALAALALTRENALAFVPLLIGFIVVTRRGRALAPAAWLCAGLAVGLAPAVAHNWVAGHELHVTTSQFGPNFFIGNNAQATGGYVPLRWGRGDPRWERRDATDLAERAVGRALSPAEVSGYWTQRALDDIARAPVRWLGLLGRKAVLFVNRIELGDAEDQYTYGDWSTSIAWLTPVLSFGVLVPLAVAGIVLTIGNGAARLTAALVGVFAVTVVLTYVMARYRHPVLPLLLLFAAAAVLELPGASPRRRLVAVALALVIAVPANWPMVGQASVRAGSLYNIGRVLEDDPARLAEAATYYRKAIAWEPGYALAYSNLGAVLERTGRLDEARAAFLRAVELAPDRPEYEYNLAHLDAARGDVASATRAYERVVARDPSNADAWANLGVLLQQRGDGDAALRAFDAALAANPQHGRAVNNRGIVLAERGDLDAAIASFRRALVIDPSNREARDNLATALQARAAAPQGNPNAATPPTEPPRP